MIAIATRSSVSVNPALRLARAGNVAHNLLDVLRTIHLPSQPATLLTDRTSALAHRLQDGVDLCTGNFPHRLVCIPPARTRKGPLFRPNGGAIRGKVTAAMATDEQMQAHPNPAAAIEVVIDETSQQLQRILTRHGPPPSPIDFALRTSDITPPS